MESGGGVGSGGREWEVRVESGGGWVVGSREWGVGGRE